MTRRRGVVAALAAWLAVVLTGCVVVPTEGPVERIEGGQPACQDCVTIDVEPPAPGAEPLEVVEGFLRASSNYQPNYATARDYLTASAAGRWSPEAGVSVYTGEPTVRPDGAVVLEGRQVGALGADRTFTVQDRAVSVDFGLVEERGEWRISRPPPGLLVADYFFTAFYRPYDLFFLAGGRSLVPERIYLPNLPGRSGVASVLVNDLLRGPSGWLRPAVTSAVPQNTTLNVDSVTIVDGVAEVPLSGDLAALDDDQRTLVAAQLLLTLREATGVTGVRLTVDGQPLPIPTADPETQVVSSVPVGLEPVPIVSAEQLFAVRGGAVLQAGADDVVPELTRLPGPLGQDRLGAEQIAVSLPGDELALVADRGRALRRAPTDGTAVQTLVRGATGLLRPQYSRFDELWAVGRRGGRQQVLAFAGGRPVRVDAPALTGAEVLAFRISPDGTRMAVVRRAAGRTELGLLRISRAETITVDGWRPVTVRGPALTRITDVAWTDAATMAVLAAPSADQPLTVFTVSEDGYSVSAVGEPGDWGARALTVLLRTGTPVVLGRGGQAFRNEGSQWSPYVDEVTAVAYPG